MFFLGSFYSTIYYHSNDSLENEVQNAKNIIPPEDSMESWVRGEIPSRQIARNIDYLKKM